MTIFNKLHQRIRRIPRIHTRLNYCIAAVWFINGLLCKVLHLVPRHEQIVARILGNQFAQPLTILIGVAEIGMGCWILSKWKARINALTQLTLVVTMNTLEFFLAADLLLWGNLNAVFALLFVSIVYYNQFHLRNNPNNR
jgi:hypothetical protein